MLSKRILRNYKMNIESKFLNKEHIIIANDRLKKLLDGTRSTATIITYLYICLKVNKSKDKGFLRNIRCREISNDLGIPLSTIQDSIKTLTKTNFIIRKYNDDRSSDYEVIGYKNILSKAYTKINANAVLNNIFLQSSKDEVAGVLSVYSSIYANTIADMKKRQSINIFKDMKNFELIGQAERSRVFSKKTLLKKIKRENIKDLNRVLAKMEELGLMVRSIFREGIDKVENFLIGIEEDVLSDLFRPYESHSHIENNPLAFNKVENILYDTRLSEKVGKEYHEDLTQMYVEYGDLLFNVGVVSLQKVIYDNYDLTDQDGSKIENVCAYFRRSIENFREQFKSKV